MNTTKKTTMLMAAALVAFVSEAVAIPLPEHPRPDWERAEWANLNGEWDFAFEPKGTPVDAPARPAAFDQKIVVPFGWAAPLSGVKGEGDSAWYRREVEIPAEVAAASKDGKMTIRLAAEKTGLAVYGPRFGRMPFGPHLAE